MLALKFAFLAHFLLKCVLSDTYTCSSDLTADLSTTGQIDCRDFYVCDDNKITSTDSYIRCRSHQSCETASTSDYLRPCTDLYCDGRTSCYRQNMYVYSTSCATANTNDAYCYSAYACGGESTHYSQITNFDNVWCESRETCRYSIITTNIEDMIVYCRGYLSCQYSTITADISGSYLFCESRQSCRYSTISSNFDGIYCRGYQTCRYTTISGVKDVTELICQSQEACRYSTISSVDVITNQGMYGVAEGIISDVNIIYDYAFLDGFKGSSISTVNTITTYSHEYGFANSDIFNVSVINDYGEEYNFMSSVLEDVKEINIYSKYGLFGSVISNDGLTEMTVNLYGEYSGFNATINCFEDSFQDVCNINCFGATSCININISCFATCNVYCDISNGIACPAGYTGPSPNPTSMPSVVPTASPSNDPTDHPTENPSQHPSQHPSSRPSLMPSSIPSSNPTSNPTVFPSLDPTMSTESPMLPTLHTTAIGVITHSPTKLPTASPDGEESAITSKVDLTDCLTDHNGIFWLFLILFICFLVSLIINVIFATRMQVLKNVVNKTIKSHTNNSGNNINGVDLGRIGSLSHMSTSMHGLSGLQAELAMGNIVGNASNMHTHQFPMFNATNSNHDHNNNVNGKKGLRVVQVGQSDVELGLSNNNNNNNLHGENGMGNGDRLNVVNVNKQAAGGLVEGQKAEHVTKLDQGLIDAIEADDNRNDDLYTK